MKRIISEVRCESVVGGKGLKGADTETDWKNFNQREGRPGNFQCKNKIKRRKGAE